MAQVPRPPKQGNTATYAAKVAAGYTKILAGEIDADFDTIYNAWNSGADATNLKDGSITGAKLVADAVGPRELADGAVFTNHLQDRAVTTAKILDGNVTDAKIASVAWAKVTGAPAPPTIPTTLPPSGPASDDLTGTYPAPSLGTVQGGALRLNPRGLVGAGDGTFMDVIANSSVGTAYDLNKATWQLKLDYTGDRFQIVRLPPQGGAATALVEVRGSDGKMVATLADNQISHDSLSPGAATWTQIFPGDDVVQNIAAATETVLTEGTFTTRGGPFMCLGQVGAHFAMNSPENTTITWRIRLGGTAGQPDGSEMTRAVSNCQFYAGGAGAVVPCSTMLVAWSFGQTGTVRVKLTAFRTTPTAAGAGLVVSNRRLLLWEWS